LIFLAELIVLAFLAYLSFQACLFYSNIIILLEVLNACVFI